MDKYIPFKDSDFSCFERWKIKLLSNDKQELILLQESLGRMTEHTILQELVGFGFHLTLNLKEENDNLKRVIDLDLLSENKQLKRELLLANNKLRRIKKVVE